mmetsp:Transcript_22759/g.56226  ORF Transcript_22759/g.56226 Transcript_22759/m.56226 type:complete len:257 (+) Transcript_22759:174-944(+)
MGMNLWILESFNRNRQRRLVQTCSQTDSPTRSSSDWEWLTEKLFLDTTKSKQSMAKGALMNHSTAGNHYCYHQMHDTEYPRQDGAVICDAEALKTSEMKAPLLVGGANVVDGNKVFLHDAKANHMGTASHNELLQGQREGLDVPTTQPFKRIELQMKSSSDSSKKFLLDAASTTNHTMTSDFRATRSPRTSSDGFNNTITGGCRTIHSRLDQFLQKHQKQNNDDGMEKRQQQHEDSQKQQRLGEEDEECKKKRSQP